MGPTELWVMLSELLQTVAHNRSSDEQFREDSKHSVWHVLKILLCCLVHGMSLPSFYERRNQERGFLKRLGLPNRTISRSQVYKRLRNPVVSRALLELLRQSASRALRQLGEQEVRIIPMDLTKIESEARRDPFGAWGFSSQGGFHGYKLGLIVSTSGVILGMTLMRANWTEFRVHRRLLKMARETILTAFGRLEVDLVVADAGFDGEPIYREAHRLLRAPLLCPVRRKRNPKAKRAREVLAQARRQSPCRERDQMLWKDPEVAQNYRHRTLIEQVNGQLKASLRIHHIPTRRRGVKRLTPICLAKLVIYNCALNVNIAKGMAPRRIARLLAG